MWWGCVGLSVEPARTGLVELLKKDDIDFARILIKRYHPLGLPQGGGAARDHRWFAWVVDGYVCAVAWLHDSAPFRRIAEQFRIGYEASYFMRRLCKTAPGDHLADLLKALADKLKDEGKECIWTFGLDEYTDAVYRLAGFKEVGKTSRKRRSVYVLRLRG